MVVGHYRVGDSSMMRETAEDKQAAAKSKIPYSQPALMRQKSSFRDLVSRGHPNKSESQLSNVFLSQTEMSLTRHSNKQCSRRLIYRQPPAMPGQGGSLWPAPKKQRSGSCMDSIWKWVHHLFLGAYSFHFSLSLWLYCTEQALFPGKRHTLVWGCS